MTVCYSSLPVLSSTVVFSLVGVMLMIGHVLYPLKATKDLRARASACLQLHLMFLNFPSWTSKIKVHFSSTAAENTPKRIPWLCAASRGLHSSLKVSSFSFIKAIFQLDWDAYLSPLRGACWVYSAADLLEV